MRPVASRLAEHRTISDVVARMRPRNNQLGKLVARLSTRGLQDQIIDHWNRTRRLPEGFLRLPFLSPTHGRLARHESLV